MKSTLEQQPYSHDNFSNLQQPLIELISLKKEEKISKIPEFNEIIFTIRGKSKINSTIYPEYVLDRERAIFLPIECSYHLTASEDCYLAVMCINPFEKINGALSAEDLYQIPQKETKKGAGVIRIKSSLKTYLSHLEIYINEGFNSTEFYELKITELFLLLTRYYTENELLSLFQYILTPDIYFTSFVLNNWHHVRNARELAEISNIQEASFNKKFKKLFGTSPYKWLNEKRSGKIYHEIINTTQTFKSISENHHFKSQQHFNDYCLRYFKASPGTIRKKKN